MAYEIGSGSKALTLPNPFKTHNVFLLASALIVGGAAIWLLFDVRQEIPVDERDLGAINGAASVAADGSHATSAD